MFEFTKDMLLENLFEEKTCKECAFSSKGYLICPKTHYTKKGIILPEHETCECWSKLPYAIQEEK
jgi:hypothetical protein